MPKVLALIPARAGSKGLKGKNGLPLSGHPLLAYSVAAAKQARRVDRVLCSTDGQYLADMAKEYGAEVPFLRPAELAQDDTRDLPVFLHSLSWLKKHESWVPDIVVQLRPTSPLRRPGQVDKCIEILEAHPQATGVRSVCVAPSNPFKMWRPGEDASPFMRNLLDVPGVKEPYNEPRQSLPMIWWQTGTIDAVRRPVLESGSMTGDRLLPMEIGAEQAVDIDSDINLTHAELLLGAGGYIRPERSSAWSRIRLMVLDVDGTLTPGTMYYTENGEFLKRFHTRDAHGIGLLRERGIRTFIMTAEDSAISKARARKMGVEEVHAGIADKRTALRQVAERAGVPLSQVCYVGDDLGDLAAISMVADEGGLACAVADAVPAVKRAANFQSELDGGCGAVREICDRILRYAL